MKKINAYTFTEIILCIVILSIIAKVALANIKITNKQLNDDLSKTKVLKAVEVVQQASEDIKQLEKKSCPMQTFIINSAGTYEYTLLNANGTAAANATDVANLYSNYIKFQQTSLKFCNYTSACSDNNIIGGKIPGEAYIGFKVYNTISNCPNYYSYDGSNISGKGKCWGELYVKLADKYNNDVKGQDVFVFGLNETGVAY